MEIEVTGSGPDGQRKPSGPIGLMGAMESEVELIQSCLVDAHPIEGPCPLMGGRLDGTDVLLAQCGVGKVNAALAASALAQNGASCIIFTGVAGAAGPDLDIGDVVVGNRFVQHDADGTAFDDPIGVVPGEPRSWQPDERLHTVLMGCAARVFDARRRVVSGTIASGDQFIGDPAKVRWIHDTFDALAVEMEGAALAQAASHLHVPFAVVRVLSDRADGTAVTDFPAFLAQAARHDRDLARAVVAELSGGVPAV